MHVYPLRCDVQHYAWGDRDFIPRLLGVENPRREPFAELWMGAHPDLPSHVQTSTGDVAMHEFIAANPTEILGPVVADTFEQRLPFLFKVLAAEAPLSIQVHPAKERAAEGFARETAAGIPMSARQRNYKDDNHKPELVAALTDFYALRGFRPLDEIGEILQAVPEFQSLASRFQGTPDTLRALYEWFMNLPQPEVDGILDPLVRRLSDADRQARYGPMDREYWVLRADGDYSRDGHRDRGLFSIYLLNLVCLRPGEAMYLPSGILHAYLEGSGLEIMANSNNVLRGGLTPKHVDVPELLSNAVFEGRSPEILHAVPTADAGERVFRTPACEFELRRIELEAEASHAALADHGPEILIVVECAGDVGVAVRSDERALQLKRGGVCFAAARAPYILESTGEAILYKATMPS